MVPGITVKRSRAERAQDIVIGALLMMCFVVAAAIAVLQFPIPLRDTPIVYHGLHLPEQAIYCPGEIFEYSSDIEITNPGIFTLHIGIMDADSRLFIDGTTEQLPSVPRPAPVRITQPVSFEIPDLPPGDYLRVAAIDADHVDSVPLFVNVPFTIGEQCGKTTK